MLEVLSERGSCLNERILNIVSDLFMVPICVTENSNVIYKTKSGGNIYIEEIDAEFVSELRLLAAQHAAPIIHFEDEDIYWGLIYSDGKLYSIGPITRISLTRGRLSAYKKKHGVIENYSVTAIGTGTITKILCLLSEIITGESESYDDIAVVNEFLSEEEAGKWVPSGNYEIYQLNQSEYEREHTGGIDYEKKIFDLVRNGDVNGIKKILYGFKPDVSDFGEVAVNSAKQQEYMMITAVTLMSRAAVEGGMNAEEAYTLGDVYMRKIEESRKNISKLQQIGIQAQIDFAERVALAKMRRSENIYVEKCKDYIGKNLRKEIKIGEIASKIGTSRSYLSHKFSEIEGITIQSYILAERLEHAANLLKYSDYPISAIAEYFKFSSQSYFGKCFKERYEITPKEYRAINTK